MSLEALTKIISPPSSPVETTGRAWSEIEKEIRVSLPEDYKKFIETYGSGTLGDFITIYNPFSSNDYTNLTKQIPAQIEILRHFKSISEEECPYPIFPEASGLLPLGGTDNGDHIYWVTNGEPTNWWIVVNESRGPTFSEHNCNITSFLRLILTSEAVCTVFPDDFPDESNRFTSSKR